MKRLLAFVLSALTLLSLPGCSLQADTHTFYYPRGEYQYGTRDSVLAGEERDISGHSGDLFYLISLYLSGPLDEELISPFPASTRLLSVEQENSHVRISLTDSGTATLDSEFTLAGACLAMTCMELPEVTLVTIESRDRTITLSREQILLFDTSSIPQPTPEEPK